MDLQRVEQLFIESGKPAFRLKQVMHAYYRELRRSWDEVTTLSEKDREQLQAAVIWDVLKPLQVQESAKGDTVKTLFSCADGKTVEAVLMRHRNGRNTVCVSSQIGCPMRCEFCATGALGFTRNLTSDEIAEQVIHYARILKEKGEAVTNVVYMGMGEPFNNYDEVMKSVRLLNNPHAFALGVRHISISTCGIVPGILKLAEESLQVNLAISLHAAINETRDRIMPVNKAYPLKALVEAIDAYSEKTNRKVLFEYVMLHGINDAPRDAEALAALLRHRFRLYQVNLIKYHETHKFKSTPEEERMTFMKQLQDLGVPVTHRVTFGEDIDAACGQLAANAVAGLVHQRES
jgi:23S rRNA (adenine2503-C2)-methyltransferase